MILVLVAKLERSMNDELLKKNELFKQRCDVFLKELYKVTGGEYHKHADTNSIQHTLGFTPDDVSKITSRLSDDSKIELYLGPQINITHLGIIHVESIHDSDVIKQRKKERMTYLRNLYEKTEGDIYQSVYYSDLGFSEDYSAQLALFLEHEGLIEFECSCVKISHAGIETVETASSDMLESQALKSFASIIFNIEQAENCQIMTNSPGATQIMNVSEKDICVDEIQDLLRDITDTMKSVEVSSIDIEKIKEILNEIRYELTQEKPNKNKMSKLVYDLSVSVTANAIFNSFPILLQKCAAIIQSFT